jgi:hypothetical protein
MASVWVGRFEPNTTPSERRILGFDYGPYLPDGAGIVAATWLCSVALSSTVADANAADRLSSDAASIDATLMKTAQVFFDGVQGVDYMIRCLAETSDGQELEMAGSLLCLAPV